MNTPEFIAEQSKCLYCENPNCAKDCPAGCSPQQFLKAAQLQQPQDFQRSAADILSKNPLGSVCGMVCPDKFCQKNCNRQGMDKSIEIPCSQSYIVETARKLNREPKFIGIKAIGKKAAVIGSGPAGIAAAAILSNSGVNVDIYEQSSVVGGQMAMIPQHRLPEKILKEDLDFCLRHVHDESVKVEVKLNTKADATKLASQYDYVIVASGQSVNHFPKEFEPIKKFILQPQDILQKNLKCAGNVVVIGGGAVANDVCAVLKKQGVNPIVVYRRQIRDMPITKKEQEELIACAEVITKAIVDKVEEDKDQKLNVKIQRVNIEGRGDKMTQVKTGEEMVLKNVTAIVLASGFGVELQKQQQEEIIKQFKNVFWCTEVGTVVEAVSSGKSAAAHALAGDAQKSSIEHGKTIALKGYDFIPADMKTNIFGAKIVDNPFVLSASPLTDGYYECKKALDMGWAGVILKTAFDGIPIHIPNLYMSRMGNESHGNCDNVSGRSLDQVIQDIKKLKQEYPNKLIGGSTGGPVFGEDAFCKNGWQKNIAKLVNGGAELVELSLSCPQGGDSSEGQIAAQSITQSCKIVRWALDTPELTNKVPLLFKMTAACTSVQTVIKAVQNVIDEYGDKKNAGITMANSFPAIDIKPTVRKEMLRYPYDCIVVGMGGKHVQNISYLSLENVYNIKNLKVSGNGGVTDYKSAADFIALGTQFVQVCALAEERGVRIIDDLVQGLAHFMKELKMSNIPELYRSWGKPELGFMDIPAKKSIAQLVRTNDCIGCGNCVDCPYIAITMEKKGVVKIDPHRCIGCSLCTRRCPGKCLDMVERGEGVPQPDI